MVDAHLVNYYYVINRRGIADLINYYYVISKMDLGNS